MTKKEKKDTNSDDSREEHTDYFIDEHAKNCLDHFCIATK